MPSRVRVYMRSDDDWHRVAELRVDNGTYGDGFGSVVAVQSNSVVVGAPLAERWPYLRAGRAYVFTQSPYRDLTKASQYFAELNKKYPRSPWAFQGQAWMTLINEHLAAEEQRRITRLRLEKLLGLGSQ